MATRSNIGILNTDGSVYYIYCHYDGYLEHNGKILNEHYTTEDKVRQLINLGDLSILGPEIGEQQDFNGPRNKNWCLAYGRDRGEDQGAQRCSHNDYTTGAFEEYIYLFTPGKGWQVREHGITYWGDLNEALKYMVI